MPRPQLHTDGQWGASPQRLSLGKTSPHHSPHPSPVSLSLRRRERGLVGELRTYWLGGGGCKQDLLTKRKHNDQFPGTLDTTVESLLALCLEMCQPWVHSECWIQALPSGTTQPGGEDGKEQIPASWAGTATEQSPGGGGSLELWLLTQTEQGKGVG